MRCFALLCLVFFSFTLSAQPVMGTSAGEEMEHPPKFPGGEKGIQKYLAKSLVYPEKARLKDIEGRVMTRFIIDVDGSVTGVQVTESAHKLLDEEAIRVVLAMPDWKPGLDNGVAVQTYYELPIVFKLETRGPVKRKRSRTFGSIILRP